MKKTWEDINYLINDKKKKQESNKYAKELGKSKNIS